MSQGCLTKAAKRLQVAEGYLPLRRVAALLICKRVSASLLRKGPGFDLPKLPYASRGADYIGFRREEWKAGAASLAWRQYDYPEVLQLRHADGENRRFS